MEKKYKNDQRKICNRLLRASNTCGLCGEQITKRKEATIDHIIPLSRGGSDSVHNVQVAHEKCNQEKGNKLPDEIKLKKENEHA